MLQRSQCILKFLLCVGVCFCVCTDSRMGDLEGPLPNNQIDGMSWDPRYLEAVHSPLDKF